MSSASFVIVPLPLSQFGPSPCNGVAQSLDAQALHFGPVKSRRFGNQREGVGVTHQREVGVGLLGARLEALEHVGDVDGKRNLPTPRSPFSQLPPSPLSLFRVLQPNPSVPDGPR